MLRATNGNVYCKSAEAHFQGALNMLLLATMNRCLAFIFLWLATCTTKPPGAPDERVACTVDRDCASGFCDRGVCTVPEQDASRAPAGVLLGGSCITGHKGAICQNLMCIDGRCRSCLKDDECDPSGSKSDIHCENRKCVSNLASPHTIATSPPDPDHPFAPD